MKLLLDVQQGLRLKVVHLGGIAPHNSRMPPRNVFHKKLAKMPFKFLVYNYQCLSDNRFGILVSAVLPPCRSDDRFGCDIYVGISLLMSVSVQRVVCLSFFTNTQYA